MKNILRHFHIAIPSDDKIQTFFSPRSEYYYEVAGKTLSNVPVLFIGDAYGGTDYKFGISLDAARRGLIASKDLTDRIKAEGHIAFPGIVDFHNQMWKNVVAAEFGQQNPLLNKSTEIIFKYWMDGRIVDGKLVDREAYISEVIQ